MKVLAILALLVIAYCAAAPTGFFIHRELRDDAGNLQFLVGELGTYTNHVEYINSISDVLGLVGSEEFRPVRKEVDPKGNLHIFFQQYNHGLEVDGGEIAIHFRPADNKVFALSLSVLPAHADLSNVHAQVPVSISSRLFYSAYEHENTMVLLDEPESVFLLHEGAGYAALRSRITYIEEGRSFPTTFNAFVCPETGELIVEFPLFHPALNREIYNMKNSDNNTLLPGTLVRTEGQAPSGDSDADAAYDNAGVCYDFYKTKFNRDSFDNEGSTMLSTVHYGVDYNNAFWNGSQMVYGDGDGVIFSNFAADLSVVCHELTHAVVQYTAGLRYFKESGALNEGFADIFGSSADIYNHSQCIYPQQWQIGYETYIAGAALRFMNNPTMDGSSYDYYPERYMGLQDTGGVHSNSGIANLAYVLTVQGGVHPRQKTKNWVQGIGIENAEQVFYSALSNYMMRTTNFAGARMATEVAASELYDDDVAFAVGSAWYAVGVGLPPVPPSSSSSSSSA